MPVEELTRKINTNMSKFMPAWFVQAGVINVDNHVQKYNHRTKFGYYSYKKSRQNYLKRYIL